MKKIILFVLTLPLLVLADTYCKAYSEFENLNFAQASKTLAPLIQKGDTKAQNLLALVYLEDAQGVHAQKLFQSAAGKGNLQATYNLGIYYASIYKNEKSLQWMLKAKALLEGKLALGVLYANVDVAKSKYYFSLAAKEGNSFAKSHLCALVATNQVQMDNQYVNMCQGDLTEDMYVVGKFYTSQKVYGFNNAAIFYLELAAKQNHIKAMNLLGESLYKRRGPSDEEKALSYFKNASSLGSVKAKVNAAWIYYTGVKWTRNAKLGFTELNAAYQQNNAKAQFYMGVLKIRGFTFSGETVRQDINSGIKDIQNACAQEDIEAIQYMLKNYPEISQNKGYKKILNAHYIKVNNEKELHYLRDAC